MSEEVFQWPEDRDPAPEIRDLTEDGSLTGGLLVRVIRRTGEDRAGEALLLKEQALRIVLDGKRMTRLVCTGADLPALAAGWLLTSGFISRASDLASLKITGAGQEFLAEAERRTKTAQRTMAPVCARKIRREWLFHLADTFRVEQPLYLATHSIHSCILSRSGKVLYLCEDIGRHNALDKAAGYAILHGIPPAECEVYLSGRLPVDMVEKALRAGFPVLAGKALPTAEAVEFASAFGLLLAGRAGAESFEVFCGEKKLI